MRFATSLLSERTLCSLENTQKNCKNIRHKRSLLSQFPPFVKKAGEANSVSQAISPFDRYIQDREVRKLGCLLRITGASEFTKCEAAIEHHVTARVQGVRIDKDWDCLCHRVGV